MITSEQKLLLKRQAEKNPGIGMIALLDLLEKEQDAKVAKQISSIKREISDEMKVIIDKRFPALEKVIQELNGEDGDDADPTEVARALLEMPEFIKMTKANDGHTPTEAELTRLVKPMIGPLIPPPKKGDPGAPGKDAKPQDVAKTLLSNPGFISMVKGDKGDPGGDGGPDKPIEIAAKLNTLEEKVDMKVIRGLATWMEKIKLSLRERKKGGGSGGGGGMGIVEEDKFSTSSATTSVTTTYKIAGNGTALWVYYNGQGLSRGTHYTVSGKTVTFLFTLQDSTNVSITYIRT